MYISVACVENAMKLSGGFFLGKGNIFVIYVRSSVWCFYVNLVELTQCDHEGSKSTIL